MKKIALIFVLFLTANFFTFAEMYKANAEASYYADKFHGRKTASGEIFNMYDFTAAHKTLPFNTTLKITNISNGKSVTVRVNDRGPFVQGREIDLSKAAAQKLDMISTGTAQVSIEILQLGASTALSSATANAAKTTPVSTSKSTASQTSTHSSSTPSTSTSGTPSIVTSHSTAPSPSTVNSTSTASSTSTPNAATVTEEVAVLLAEPEENLRWDIQIGSFSERANAEALAQKLLKADFKNVVYQKAGGITRVVIRDRATSEVQPILERLEEKGFKDYLVKRRQ